MLPHEMDSEVSQNHVPLRRSTRQSSTKAQHVGPTARAPIKRTKRAVANPAPGAAVSGSHGAGNAPDDEDSPSKKSRLEPGAEDGRGDEKEMDDQETNDNLGKNQDQEMIPVEDPPHSTRQKMGHSSLDKKLVPCVVLERFRSNRPEDVDTDWMKTRRVQPAMKEPAASAMSATQPRRVENKHEVRISNITSMGEYKEKMEARAKSAGIPRVNHYVSRAHPTSEASYTTQRVNNIPPQKQSVKQKKQGVKKSTGIKGSSGSSMGFIRYLWGLLLLVLLSSAAHLAYKNVPVPHWPAGGGGHPSRSVKPGEFENQLSLLETRFPRQRPELWKRSGIHLARHLQTAQPTQPVSLILTAGHGAERTLHCLAQGLASAFSSALNASVLHIDGASKASEDSDQVKLDIDTQLQAAFEGDKPAAVIHRFEELPPSSTLIFYRYCDHETAAYKRVFLAFTVLLPQDELEGQQSLKEVEEMVHDYVKKRFLGSVSQAAFNKMDLDKFGGLWSRISHLILPVASENEVEQRGC